MPEKKEFDGSKWLECFLRCIDPYARTGPPELSYEEIIKALEEALKKAKSLSKIKKKLKSGDF